MRLVRCGNTEGCISSTGVNADNRTVPPLGVARKREIPTVSTAGLDSSQPGASRPASTPPDGDAIVRAAALDQAWSRRSSDVLDRYVVGAAGVAAAGFHRLLTGAWRPGHWFWARAADLAAAADISPNSATTYLRDLVAAGVLAVRHHGRRGLELLVVTNEDRIRALATPAAWARGIAAVRWTVASARARREQAAADQTQLDLEGEGGAADSSIAENADAAAKTGKLGPVKSQILGALTGNGSAESTEGIRARAIAPAAPPPKASARRGGSGADIGQEHLVLAGDQHALLAVLETHGVATRLADGRELTAAYLRVAAGLSPAQLDDVLQAGSVSAPWDLIVRRRHWAAARQQGGLMGIDLRSLRDPDCEALLSRIPDLRWSPQLIEAVEQLASRGLLLSDLQAWVAWMAQERHRWAGSRMAFWSDLRRWLQAWEGERAAQREEQRRAEQARREALRRREAELAQAEAARARAAAELAQNAQRLALEAAALPGWAEIRAAAGRAALGEHEALPIRTWWDARSVLGAVEGDALVVSVPTPLFQYTLRDRASFRPVYGAALEALAAAGQSVRRLVVRVGDARATDLEVFALEGVAMQA